MNPSDKMLANRTDRAHAETLDQGDDLAGVRAEFAFPPGPDGEACTYLCGNSLGLMPKSVPDYLAQETLDWSRHAVEGHFKAQTPWFSYHEIFREPGARLVGALPGEVVMMNSLTVNLHLMMASFYRPSADRFKILIEDHAFPSDRYAVASQAAWHGYDPADAIVVLRAGEGETLTHDDIEKTFSEHGDSIALVMLSGVNFVTGQFFDMQAITDMAHRAGCNVGFDLAHAAGNLPLRLHDWGVDFAAWCSYKYLNAGPGAVAGCYVHEKHGSDPSLHRLAGWWGNDPETRFRMSDGFVPRPGADGWQLSNPSIFAMVPLRASLEIFDRFGMETLRAKSVKLTAYLEGLLDGLAPLGVQLVTPRNPAERGCQLSVRIPRETSSIVNDFAARGVVVDSRPPDIIRVAPVPLYNSYCDAWDFVDVLSQILSDQ